MTAFTAMLDDVMPELNGCSKELAINALLNAAIELYKKSWILSVDITPITVVPGTSVYVIPAIANKQIIGVRELYVGASKIDPIAGTITSNADHLWKTDVGGVVGYQIENGSSIRLYKVPQVADVINATIVVAPSKSATDIDTFIYDMYSEALAAGAKARLMTIPHKPFTDAGTAMTYRAQFAEAIRDAKWKAYKASTNAGMQVQLKPVI
jgi:hypothetical protein